MRVYINTPENVKLFNYLTEKYIDIEIIFNKPPVNKYVDTYYIYTNYYSGITKIYKLHEVTTYEIFYYINKDGDSIYKTRYKYDMSLKKMIKGNSYYFYLFCCFFFYNDDYINYNIIKDIELGDNPILLAQEIKQGIFNSSE